MSSQMALSDMISAMLSVHCGAEKIRYPCYQRSLGQERTMCKIVMLRRRDERLLS
jgi:hypothetical protein